ncbi:hypothetical protein SGPA1_21269 [Streptomyces misionensis JCM 4497]
MAHPATSRDPPGSRATTTRAPIAQAHATPPPRAGPADGRHGKPVDTETAARLTCGRTPETDGRSECHGHCHHALPFSRRPGVPGLTGSAPRIPEESVHDRPGHPHARRE